MFRWFLSLIRRCFRIWTMIHLFNGLKLVQDFNTQDSLNSLTEVNKCPYCYGTTACFYFQNNRIDVNYQHVFDQLLNGKNIYHGFLDEKPVILKKLASNLELSNYEEMVNKRGQRVFMNYSKRIVNRIHSEIINEITLRMDDQDVKLRVCPKVDNFNKQFIEKDIVKLFNIYNYYINLWTTVKINPESFILEILSAKDGWPVPKYYGSCGRLILVENVGSTLYFYYYHSWMRRAEIAASMLDAAYIFTFKNPRFAIYLTDISPDNIAVDRMNNVKFIDLENIIIVDRTPNANYSTFNSVHKSQVFEDDDNLLSFSPKEICLHKVSDHNYFCICQILWQTNGAKIYGTNFLHGVPENVLKQFPELMDLMYQCSVPDSKLDNRIMFGIKLNYLLRRIISYYS